jgi:BioD-like phosphotransacetylase family protein
VRAPQRIFLAATGQNRGKTTVSLGLAAGFVAGGHRLGFLKPVGQRYLVVDGTRADEDAVLMKEVFDLPDPLNDMSPVTLPRHFTTDFVMGRVNDDLASAVADADQAVAHDKDVVLIEGTGHAGVGAVIGLSNATVAAMLEAPVLIVSEGGVGRPIDEIVLNHALFERHGVRVAGAVINKVNVDANPDLPEVLRRGLAQHGIHLIGCIPFSELLAGEATPGAVIGGVAIGAMRADHAVPYLRDRTLVITPGDRDDLVNVTLEAFRSGESRGRSLVTGLVLTGGFRPPPPLVDELRAAGLFTYLVETDTYRTAQDVHDILVKTHPTDTDKIATIIDLVGGALPPDTLLARL